MLATRLKSAVPLVALLVLAFFLPGMAGEILFLLFSAVMLWVAMDETLDLLVPSDEREALLKGIAVCHAWGLLAWLCLSVHFRSVEQHAHVIGLAWNVLTAIALALACFRGQPSRATMRKAGAAILAMILAQALMCMPRVYFMGGATHAGSFVLFFMIVVTKMSDIGAYVLGSTTARRPAGNHKLAPWISPGKSWEGLAGGILAGVVAAVVFKASWGGRLLVPGDVMASDGASLTLGWLDVIALGILLPVVGLLGDLMESVLKRAAQVKDSGRVPGLGGVLDILDSLVLCAPFFLLWLLVKQTFRA